MKLHALVIGAALAVSASAVRSDPIDMRYARGGPANGIVLSRSGIDISFCPILACILQPTADHQRASALFRAETQDDGHSEEQTLAVETVIKTGYAKKWKPNEFFQVGDNVSFANRNAVYRATQAGRSADSGEGPTGKGDDIPDGSVRWKWINDAAIDSKVGIYNETVVDKGAGASWGQANNVHLQPGVVPSFNINTELDFGNEAAECVIGIANCYNLLVSTGGRYRSTAGVYIVSENKGIYAAHWGLRVAGPYVASDADVEDDGGGAVGIAVGLFAGSAHGLASILDRSKSPVGLKLEGTYTRAQIEGKGFMVSPEGDVIATSVRAKVFKLPFGAPEATTDCSLGEMRFDTRRIYLCMATGRWKTVLLSELSR